MKKGPTVRKKYKKYHTTFGSMNKIFGISVTLQRNKPFTFHSLPTRQFVTFVFIRTSGTKKIQTKPN